MEPRLKDRRGPSRRARCVSMAANHSEMAGESYLRRSIEVAAAYSVSYGNVLGLYFLRGDAACRGTVHPLVTLFCAQSVLSEL